MYLRKKEVRKFLVDMGWGVNELKEILDIEYSEAVRMMKGERIHVDTAIKFGQQVYMSRLERYIDWEMMGVNHMDSRKEVLQALEIIGEVVDV